MQVVSDEVLGDIGNTPGNASRTQFLGDFVRLSGRGGSQRCFDEAVLERLALGVVVNEEAELARRILLAILHLRVDGELVAFCSFR